MCPRFLLQILWLLLSTLPAPQAVSKQPMAVLSWVCPLNPEFQDQPLFIPANALSDWVAQGWGMDHLCRFLSLLFATSWLCSPLRLWSFCPDIRTGPHRVHRSSFFFFSFHPAYICGELSCPFRHLRSSGGVQLVFSRWSVRIVPLVEVFLMHLWEEVNSTSYDPSPLFQSA